MYMSQDCQQTRKQRTCQMQLKKEAAGTAAKPQIIRPEQPQNYSSETYIEHCTDGSNGGDDDYDDEHGETVCDGTAMMVAGCDMH